MKFNTCILLMLSISVFFIPKISTAKTIKELFQQGDLIKNSGKHFDITTIWPQVLQSDTENASYYNDQGNRLYEEERFEEAIDAYREAIRLEPSSAIPRNGLCAALYALEKFEEAIDACREAIRLEPGYVSALVNLGNALSALEQLREAIAFYEQAIHLEPEYATAHANLGKVLFEQGRLEEAIVSYEQAIRLEPNNSASHLNLGLALFEQGRWEEAIVSYEQAIRLEPRKASPHVNLGNVLYAQGQVEEAITSYEQAIRLEPRNASPHVNLGLLLRQQGKLEEAFTSCRQTLQIPNDTTIWSISSYPLAHNCLGLILLEQEKYQEARDEFKQAIALEANWHIPRNNLQEIERSITLNENPQHHYPNDSEWLPQNDPDVIVLRSVVRVIVDTLDGVSDGTGWIVKREGNQAWVLTARHVLLGEDKRSHSSNKIQVDFYSQPPDGQFHRRQPAQVVQMTPLEDETLDLALLEVTDVPEDVQPFTLSSEHDLEDEVRIIGHPHSGLVWSVVKGSISNFDSRTLQIDTTIAKGNSGGPVLDAQNRVIGIVGKINNANTPQTSGFGFAYPLKYIENILQEWGVLPE